MNKNDILDNSLNITPESFLPKYYKLKQALLTDIQNGVYPPNSKLPSESQLRKKYNISSTPIKRVIRELVSEGIIYTIQGKGCFVNGSKLETSKIYQNINIDYMRNKRIVFITPGMLDGFYSPILQGLLKMIQKRGYRLEIYNSEGEYAVEMKLLSKCLEEMISGLIFIPNSYERDYRHLFQIQKKGIPVILVDRNIKNSYFDYVGSDNINASKSAVKYLIKLGHKRILYWGRRWKKDNSSTILERYEGYRQALIESGIKIDPDLVLDDAKGTYYTWEIEVEDKVKKLLKKKIKFTAIFAINDGLAINIYRKFKQIGIKVPQDVSIIAFDDSEIAEKFELPITTVRQDVYGMGLKAGEQLFKRIDAILEGKQNSFATFKPEKIFSDTKLIIRKSVCDLRNR